MDKMNGIKDYKNGEKLGEADLGTATLKLFLFERLLHTTGYSQQSKESSGKKSGLEM